MINVIVTCEGQTEVRFIKDVLVQRFAVQGVYIQPRLIATSRTAKGGSLTKDRVLHHLKGVLRQRSDTYVTTFFDLYGLSGDFPGRIEAALITDAIARSDTVEKVLQRVVVEEVGCRPDRFFAHIQPYEFEALIFSDVEQMSIVERDWEHHISHLKGVRESVKSPEYINDGRDTHPSARLATLPGYRKVFHGTTITSQIGLDRIRSECQHFDQWLAYIEALKPLKRTDH